MTNTGTKFADMFIEPADDPRVDPPTQADELTTLVAFLRWQRETLELKCSGLDAAQLAHRSVDDSTMSLLGLVRHMADVECSWFQVRMAGLDTSYYFRSAADPDAALNGAVADPSVVAEAWETWRSAVAFSDRFVAEAPNLEVAGNEPWHGKVSLRWVLVHM